MSLTRDQYRRITIQQKQKKQVNLTHLLINVRSNYPERPYPSTAWAWIVKNRKSPARWDILRLINKHTPEYWQPNIIRTQKQFPVGGIVNGGPESIVGAIDDDRNSEYVTKLNEIKQ